MSDLSDRLKNLAGRGTPRGAADVFASAQAQAAAPAKVTALQRRATVATAIAASVVLLGGIAAALTTDGEGSVARQTSGNHAIIATSTSSTPDPGAPPTTLSEATKVYLASTRLIPFDQCGSLNSYAKREALKVVGPYGLPGGSGGLRLGMGGAAAGTGMARSGAEDGASVPQARNSAGGGAGTPAYSDTNVQEAGIDEPDSVKTDGKTIFHASNGKVFATSAGDNPELIGSIAISGAQEMLRVAGKLIVVSPGGGVYATDSRAARGGASGASMPYGGGQLQTRFTVVDVSNPRAMKETGHLDVDGGYVSARTVDGVARLVVRSDPNLAFSYPQDGTPHAEAEAKQHNTDVVKAATTDTWLPHYTATDDRGREQTSKPLVACGSSYHPPAFSGFGMLSVLSFNTENPSFTRAASVMANGEIVYASPTRVYVATNSWGDVSTGPGMQEVAPSAATLIHAFDITDPAQAVYRESGRVRGTVLNQFAMSEYNGALRVATTDPNGGSESFLTVLGESGNALVQIGQVGGLGKGERIYGVRFIDATAYVVTFRQVDPLYVIDLREPTKPKVVGELHITGYSAYLHPIGDGLLLGVGQEATAEGRRAGLQASMFDVRNPAAPKLVARHVIAAPNGGSSSSAEFDHHAFLYWPKTKLAVLPVQVYEQDKQQPFNGAVGLKIGEAAITEAGRVEPPRARDQYFSEVQRSVVVGDRLYMTTLSGVLVTRLDNLGQTAWVAYPVEQPQPYEEGKPQPQPEQAE
ncbi:MAG TPA: beta-propeller domain-containing protein [Acidimicrobiales bacterium]|nr:beta-propeller domain-containing protein [Acidimicrobiales bacterium]